MTDAELMAVLNERDRLRAQLAEVRRLLLPHPDAKAGEDAGCACDLHTAVTAAAWAAAELKRLRDELAERKAAAEIQAALNSTLRAEIRRQMDDIAELRRVNEQVRDELAALRAGGDRVQHTGGE